MFILEELQKELMGSHEKFETQLGQAEQLDSFFNSLSGFARAHLSSIATWSMKFFPLESARNSI